MNTCSKSDLPSKAKTDWIPWSSTLNESQLSQQMMQISPLMTIKQRVLCKAWREVSFSL